jgi:hypothetical protein
MGLICKARPRSKSGPGRTTVCRVYADTALAAATENRNLGCGQTGGRWSSKFDDHYNWCVGLTDSNFKFKDSEAAARQQALAQCKSKQNLPTTGCVASHVLYKNGTCGCPSGLRGPKCDEIIVN